MKCTVLGGQGFVGQHLISYLESQGFDVFVPERNEIPSLHGSLGHVFYCIGLTGNFRSRPFDTVKAHVTVLSEILQRIDFESFLYLSSTRLYSRSSTTEEDSALSILPSDPSDLYNLSKLMGESLCLSIPKSKLRVARLSNVIGTGIGSDTLVGSLLREACSGVIKLETHPESVKDYILIQDVVRLLVSIALEGRERIYNVASGIQTAHHELLNVLQEITGCKVQIDLQAPAQSFPMINIQRIQREFDFIPLLTLDVIPQLVKLIGNK